MFASRQITHAEAIPFYYDNAVGQTKTTTATTDLARVIKEDNIGISNSNNSSIAVNKNSLLYKIRGYFRLNQNENDGNPATTYVKYIMNMALGLVSFVSLILVLFAFYLILFDKGEEGVKKAKKILTGVAIAITLMALSWLIVSFFFNIATTQAVVQATPGM